MDEGYISVAEAAERLGITPATVRNWLHNGWLKGRRRVSGTGMEVLEASVAVAIQPVPVRKRSNA